MRLALLGVLLAVGCSGNVVVDNVDAQVALDLAAPHDGLRPSDAAIDQVLQDVDGIDAATDGTMSDTASAPMDLPVLRDFAAPIDVAQATDAVPVTDATQAADATQPSDGGSPLMACVWPTGYEGNDCCWRLDTSGSTCTNGLSCCSSGSINYQNTATWPTGWSGYEEQVVVLVNQYRAMGYDCAGSYGYFPPVGPLTMNAALRQATRGHSIDQALGNFVGHVGSNGSTPEQRATAAGYTGYPSLENAGGGYGPWVDTFYGTPQSIVDGWMGSPGHCKTIMRAKLYDSTSITPNPLIDEVGIGYVNFLREQDPDQFVSHRRWTLMIGASQ